MSDVYFIDIIHKAEAAITYRQNKRKYCEIIKPFGTTYSPCKKVKINHECVFSKPSYPIGFA